jgi:prepilin-type N-terminal cleavage/methylation domain-containing protein
LNRGSSRGFTLIEALVAVTLVGIAISALVGGLGSLTNAYRRSIELDVLQQLAHQKLDELVGTGEWTTLSEGEFDGERYEDFTWELETETTTVAGLEYLRLTVTRSGPGAEESTSVETLAYRTVATTVPLGEDGP